MKKRILIVDDFSSMRQLARAALKALPNLEIHEAEHGLSAWNKLQAAPHDLLISDICMPHLNGWELVQRLRGSTHQSGLPIILLSAEPAPARLPANMRYLAKPFKPACLREMVEALLITNPAS